ncbi:MAG: ferredoxin, partial [Chloroflexota bacterium]
GQEEEHRDEPALAEDLGRARAALVVDGEVISCEPRLATTLVGHIWRLAQARKSRLMRARIDALAVRLADLVSADLLRSREGRDPDGLQAGIGTPHQELFDFVLMARLLARPSRGHAISDARRARIERTIRTLRRQRFFGGDEPFLFSFDSVDDALAAYERRRDAEIELVRAIAVAELELTGTYVDATHDEYFARFDERSLSPADRSLFPDYLVRLEPSHEDVAARSRVVEVLASGAPMKIVAATGDAFGLGAQLATTAMGVGDAFVLQSSASELYRVRDRVRAAIAHSGPALVSVHAPASGAAPSYLIAAAATESHAFPTFSYDPAAGADWKQRFALHDRHDAPSAWAEHELRYADAASRRSVERVAFTPADLALCEPRFGEDLAPANEAHPDAGLAPLARWLAEPQNGDLPFVHGIDADARLHRLVVDERLVRVVRRIADAWHRLCELDDLKREPQTASAPAATPPARAAEPPIARSEASADIAAAPSSDEPYIETPRCTTCNECVNLNPRAFAYNENRQAFLKDPQAATYKELVEAAENCQVAIIHPGKPRDPSELGLADLIARAEQFL